jgi:ubiquinone/menaquinone biosynthesis C-methylase UbiE
MDSRRTSSDTYFVQNRSDKEFARLQLQSQMLTAGMGGVLSEQSDLAIFQRVLDVGCGTGDWLIEAAKTSLSMSVLVGVDINRQMVEYARAQAEAQQVSERVQFRTMDALGILDFPAASFDLVNQRFGQSYVRIWEWPKLLAECQRVSEPGGVIRITESDTAWKSSSSALRRLGQILAQALYRAGCYFTPDSHGITSQLAGLLNKSGLQNVQTRAYMLEYCTGTVEGERFIEDVELLYRAVSPFIQKWNRVAEGYETIYQQALNEMHQPEFVATWSLLTAWGNTPHE